MSDDISKLLGGLLSNPDAVKSLMSSLSPKEPASSLPPEKPPAIQSTLDSLAGGDDRRISLLTALKPYLNTSRSANVDKAIQLLKLTKITEVLRNEGK